MAGLFIHILTFLFVGLTTIGTLMNFYWSVNIIECLNVSTTISNLQKKVILMYHYEGCESM